MSDDKPKLTPAEAEQAAARLRRGPGSVYGVQNHRLLTPEQEARAKALAERDQQRAVTAAIVGDLQRDVDTHKEMQIGAIAQAMHQAEKATTSFTHNLQYHRDIARKIYDVGVRFIEQYWRVDESYTNEHGRRIHNRWPLRYQSEADAQKDIDRGEHWSEYDPAKGHTELKREVRRER